MEKGRTEVILVWRKNGFQDSRSGILKCGHIRPKLCASHRKK